MQNLSHNGFSPERMTVITSMKKGSCERLSILLNRCMTRFCERS